MRDGSDAVSDWPLLNALLNTASGATWVSFHHGGGVGMGQAFIESLLFERWRKAKASRLKPVPTNPDKPRGDRLHP